MNKKTYQIKVEQDRFEYAFLSLYDWNDLAKFSNKFIGKTGTMTIDFSKKKSNNQNDYFRGPLLDEIFKALRDMGHETIVTKKDAFWWVKNRFFMESYEIIDGYPHVKHYSTDNKTWKTVDWENKMEQIRIFFADLGYILPLPKKKPEPNEG